MTEGVKENITLDVEGMTCANCAQSITKSLKNLGLADAHADFTTGTVSYTSVKGIGPEEIEKRIESLGYQVKDEHAGEKQGLSTVEKRLIGAAIFTIPLFTHMFFPHDTWINNPWVQLFLCLPVYAIGAWHFGRSAWGSLKSGVPNMDVLIFMGSTAAFLYSIAGFSMFYGTDAVHDYMFFETAATIITLVLVGNVIEHRAVKRTSSAIKSLSDLRPQIAKVVMQIGEQTKLYELDAGKVKVGDLVQVNTGDRIPLDGKIVKGEARIDESMITGESVPVNKALGAEVIGGTLLEDGLVWVETTRDQRNSTLESIIGMVRNAQSDRPAIQALGDRVSAIFVPAVIGIAILTFAITYWALDAALARALMNSVAVLVISCPCAMGLATPTAVVAGIGKAAQQGILIKGGSTLEEISDLKYIIFDKTGTLTTGKFRISDPVMLNGMPANRAKAIIMALEQASSHPIAKSITDEWSEVEPVKLNEVKEQKGRGIEGSDADGNEYRIGRAIDSSGSEVRHDLALWQNGDVIAYLDIEDEIKPNAAETVQAIREMDIEPILLSGDREEKCQRVAQQLGIEQYYSQKLPREKLEIIRELNGKGKTAMVGDGINDGPALSLSNVGISLKGATDVAIDSARVVLLNANHLSDLPRAIGVGKLTYKTIKQNLFWAFFYNVVAIPLAAAGYLNPMIAALAMAFSDVVVLGNSLRLRYR